MRQIHSSTLMRRDSSASTGTRRCEIENSASSFITLHYITLHSVHYTTLHFIAIAIAIAIAIVITVTVHIPHDARPLGGVRSRTSRCPRSRRPRCRTWSCSASWRQNMPYTSYRGVHIISQHTTSYQRRTYHLVASPSRQQYERVVS